MDYYHVRNISEVIVTEPGQAEVNTGLGMTPHNDTSTEFFPTYYSLARMMIESFAAVIACLANIGALLLLAKGGGTKQNGAVYRILFYNLGAANAIACVLSWLANNSLYFIQSHLDKMDCKAFLYFCIFVFISAAFGIESVWTMMGFTAVQYSSICQPMVPCTTDRPKKISVFVFCTWLCTFVVSCIPILAMVFLEANTDCSILLQQRIIQIMTIAMNIVISMVGALYVATVILCLIIFHKIQVYSRESFNARFDQQIQEQKRTFGTTVILLLTLGICTLPYTILFIITLKTSEKDVIERHALIYFMNLLPYFKFLSDPIIFGLRMREIREGFYRVMIKCGLNVCVCPATREEFVTPSSPAPFAMRHVTFL